MNDVKVMALDAIYALGRRLSMKNLVRSRIAILTCASVAVTGLSPDSKRESLAAATPMSKWAFLIVVNG